MSKFKVGDRVRVVDAGNNDADCLDGMEGVVVKDGCVEFEGWTEGHSGPYHDCRTSCWYVQDEDLVKIKKTKKKRPHGKQEYKGNGKHTWEEVTDDPVSTYRLRVPGGWLYTADGNVAFVPVPTVVGYEV
jgi:hypothetical protein